MANPGEVLVVENYQREVMRELTDIDSINLYKNI